MKWKKFIFGMEAFIHKVYKKSLETPKPENVCNFPKSLRNGFDINDVFYVSIPGSCWLRWRSVE